MIKLWFIYMMLKQSVNQHDGSWQILEGLKQQGGRDHNVKAITLFDICRVVPCKKIPRD